MRKRKCLVVFNFHKVKTETGLHLHIFKISFMVFVSVSESFHRPALLCSQAETIKTNTFLSCRGEGGAGVLVNQGDAPFVRQSPHPLLSPSDRKPLAPPLTPPPTHPIPLTRPPPSQTEGEEIKNQRQFTGSGQESDDQLIHTSWCLNEPTLGSMKYNTEHILVQQIE